MEHNLQRGLCEVGHQQYIYGMIYLCNIIYIDIYAVITSKMAEIISSFKLQAPSIHPYGRIRKNRKKRKEISGT